MKTLSVRNAHRYGFVGKRGLERVYDRLHWFSFEFSFGKSYLLDGELWEGAWTLSYMIAGLLQPDTVKAPDYGAIRLDGMPFPPSERKREAWIVPYSFARKARVFQDTSVHAQILHGLNTTKNPYLKTETDYVQKFYLTPERYKRPFAHLSHERWRASCAIGLAHGKRIFCFPYIEYVRPGFIEEYHSLWLKDVVDTLRNSGALVLIPARAIGTARTLCDEIVEMRQK